jgi:hypothetical protein
MLAVKQRRSSEYVFRPAASGPRLADAAEVPAVASPARAMQAQLAERLAAPAQADMSAKVATGLSLRGRAAVICAMALVSWLPIAAAGWLILA